MTNEEIKKETKIKLTCLICGGVYSCVNNPEKEIRWHTSVCTKNMILADQILSLSGEEWELAIVKKNTELPKHNISNQDRNGETYAYYYNQAQQYMLEAGFRQEVK